MQRSGLRHDVILAAEAAQVHVEWFAKFESLYSAKFTELIGRGRSVTDSNCKMLFRGAIVFGLT